MKLGDRLHVELLRDARDVDVAVVRRLALAGLLGFFVREVHDEVGGDRGAVPVLVDEVHRQRKDDIGPRGVPCQGEKPKRELEMKRFFHRSASCRSALAPEYVGLGAVGPYPRMWEPWALEGGIARCFGSKYGPLARTRIPAAYPGNSGAEGPGSSPALAHDASVDAVAPRPGVRRARARARHAADPSAADADWHLRGDSAAVRSDNTGRWWRAICHFLSSRLITML
jgi:hypothetical protein